MRFSAFSPFGQNPFSSAEPLGRRVYEAIWSNLNGGGAQNFARDGYTDARVYMEAMAIARLLAAAQRLGDQIRPDRVLELLAEREDEHGIVVPVSATIAERQAALGAQMRLQLGSGRANLSQALRDLLGAAFVEVRQLPGASLVTAPADPASGPGNFSLPAGPRRLFKLRDNHSSPLGELVGLPYLNLDGSNVASEQRLLVGEVLVLEPEHNTLRERVTVEDELTDNTGVHFAFVTPTQPHHAGALLTTAPWPFWVSTRRHWIVELTPEASLDAETRRRTDERMAQLVRGVSTWSIVGPGGPFLLDESPLGVTPF